MAKEDGGCTDCREHRSVQGLGMITVEMSGFVVYTTISQFRPRERFLMKIMSCIVSLLLLPISLTTVDAASPQFSAQADNPIQVGVLAKRGKQKCLDRWEATASFLSSRLAAPVSIRPLSFDEIEPAVSNHEIEFILTNPSIYIRFEHDYGATRIATLVTRSPNGCETDYFGGVIFCRADRRDIRKWEDLRGCRILAVEKESFGGWQTQLLQFRVHGLRPARDFSDLIFAGCQDEVVYKILKGQADVGCVRTGILEKMKFEGKIPSGVVRVLFPWPDNTEQTACQMLHSTPLYPEWPFSMLPDTDKQLGRRVAFALMSMKPTDAAAVKAGIVGWTIPQNYQPVRQVLHSLHLPPYHPTTTQMGFLDLLRQYFLHSILVILAIILVALIVHRYSVLKLKLQQSRRLENETEKSRAFLQRIIDAFPDQLMVIDSDHRIVLANRAARDLLDDDLSLTDGIHCDLLLHGVQSCRDSKIGECPMQMVRETGAPVTLEHDHLDSNENRRIVKITASPLFDAEGKVTQIVHSCTDVTDWRQTERDRRRLMSAIDDITEVVIITDIDGRIQYVNPAFEKISGYSRSEVLGKTPGIIKSGRQSVGFYRDLWATIKSGQTWRGRLINRKKDGRLFVEDASITPVRDASENIINFVGVKRDITEMIRLEEQMRQVRKMETVGRLAGGVAHDFNNMLGVILGHTELCLASLDPKHPLCEDLIQIRRAAERSAELTRKLLTFARKQVVSPRALDLNEAIEETYRMLRRLIGEDIVLELKKGQNLRMINIDPIQVDLLLSNLCVNARDAIKAGGEIRITTTNRLLPEKFHHLNGARPENPYVCLSVSDNGHGMDKETLEHIFEPFFTTKEVGKGTGLGLATVYGIVKQNNGFIDIRSRPGEGTTFWIYFPGYQETEDAAATRKTGTHGISKDLNGTTVLLVEDERAMLALMKRVLRRLGCHTLETTSAHEALDIADQHQGQIDLLISDVVMPGIDGRELADRLREKRPKLRVLFVSGHSSRILAPLGVLEPGTHLLEKPFKPDQLVQKLKEVLD